MKALDQGLLRPVALKGHWFSPSHIKARWDACSVRSQLMLAFVAITLLASGVAATILVIDARQRTFAEMSGAVDIAEGFIREVTRDLDDRSEAERLAGKLAAQLGQVRHVRVTVLYRGGTRPAVADSASEGEGDTRPSLLIRFLGLQTAPRRVPVFVDEKQVATVAIYGNPTDEFNEAWAGLRTIATIWLGTNIAIFVILYVVIGRLLRPLAFVSAGMSELRSERAGIQVVEPRARELRDIVSSFNHLSRGLEAARQENARLFRKLIEVQEGERRRIAGELHDEVGPCLFGIMVNLSSIENASAALSEQDRSAIKSRLDDLREICDRLKQSNRAMLNQLYPVAAGHITISALIRKLLLEYRKRHSAIDFDLKMTELADSYGEERDLLLYRAVQEGVTNALRHGNASRIEIRVSVAGAPHRRRLLLDIADNGTGSKAGVEPGFGLKMMRRRVGVCGGELTLSGNEPHGLRLRIELPISPPPTDPPDEALLTDPGLNA